MDAPFVKNITWKSVDGTLFVIESEKNTQGIKILSGYVLKSIPKGKPNKTIKKAINDLQFKIVSEKLKNEPIKKDTVIDVKYYRLITGSCEIGVKNFMEQNNLKESYKASELLPILEKSNAYGLEKFKKLITW